MSSFITVMAVRHDTFFSLGSSLHIMHTFLSHTFLSHSLVILIIPCSLFPVFPFVFSWYICSACVCFWGERSLASIPLVVLAPSSKYILFLTITMFFIFSSIELLSNRASTMFRSRSSASLRSPTPDCTRPSLIHILCIISYPMTTSSTFNSARTNITKITCFKKLKISVPLDTTTMSLELTTDSPSHHTLNLTLTLNDTILLNLDSVFR